MASRALHEKVYSKESDNDSASACFSGRVVAAVVSKRFKLVEYELFFPYDSALYFNRFQSGSRKAGRNLAGSKCL
jgi:hypothetical protein